MGEMDLLDYADVHGVCCNVRVLVAIYKAVLQCSNVCSFFGEYVIYPINGYQSSIAYSALITCQVHTCRKSSVEYLFLLSESL